MVDRGKSCGGQGKELWWTEESVVMDMGKSCGVQGKELWWTEERVVVERGKSCGGQGKELWWTVLRSRSIFDRLRVFFSPAPAPTSVPAPIKKRQTFLLPN